MSIFTRIGDFIRGWRLDKFVKALVNGDHEQAEKLQDTGTKLIELVDKVKSWVKSPMGDFVTSVIPGDWDDNLKEKGIAFLEKQATNFDIITGASVAPTIGEKFVYAYNKVLETGDEDKEDGFWHELGSAGTKAFADGKITFGDGAVLAEMLYRLIVKKKNV